MFKDPTIIQSYTTLKHDNHTHTVHESSYMHISSHLTAVFMLPITVAQRADIVSFCMQPVLTPVSAACPSLHSDKHSFLILKCSLFRLPWWTTSITSTLNNSVKTPNKQNNMHTVNCMSIFVLSRSVKETLQRKKDFSMVYTYKYNNSNF